MNIYISDVGILKEMNDRFINSSNTSVKRIQPLKPTTEGTDSVMREAQKAYVAESTPAYNISLSSLGQAAIKTMQGLQNNLSAQQTSVQSALDYYNSVNQSGSSSIDLSTDDYDSFLDIESLYNNDSSEIQKSGLQTSDSGYSVAATDDTEEEETESTVNVSPNLGRYTDYELQSFLNDGLITHSQYNKELELRLNSNPDLSDIENTESFSPKQVVMQQAISAYNYQMNYQFNTMLTQ